MIVFDLECRAGGHRFEGWFASSGAFAAQQEQGLIACPSCGSPDIGKALSAPRLARKGNQIATVPAPAPAAAPAQEQALVRGSMPPEAAKMLAALAQMQAAMLESSRWVGDSFAEDVRAMHYGEQEVETVHGQATADQARELLEEGIAIAPLLFPVAPPDEIH